MTAVARAATAWVPMTPVGLLRIFTRPRALTVITPPACRGTKGLTLSATDISNLKTFFGGTTTPAPTPIPTTGKAVYDANCSACHRLGTYDASGTAPNLSGDGSRMTEEYTAGVSGHKGITLSATEISNLRTFLDAN